MKEYMSQRDTLNRKCDAITIYNQAQTNVHVVSTI